MTVNSSLYELVKDTPWARRKLVATWDQLKAETQIELLLHLNSSRSRIDPVLALKALKSENAYVRHLVARSSYTRPSDPDSVKLRSLIADDPSPLVRYADDEENGGLALMADHFLKLPHEQQLALLNSRANPMHLSQFSKALNLMLSQNTKNEIEFGELIEEFVHNPEIERRFGIAANSSYWDSGLSYDSYDSTQNLTALWDAVSTTSLEIRRQFLWRLPCQAYGKECISLQTLDRLAESDSVAPLLHRQDFHYPEFRRKLFFSGNKQFEKIRSTASLYHFYITDLEFSKLIEDNSPLLTELVIYSQCLSFAQLERLDAWLATREDRYHYVFSASRDIGQILDGWRRNDEDFKKWWALHRIAKSPELEVRNLRIFHMASRIMPPGEKEPHKGAVVEPIGWLCESAVPGSTWRTYLALKEIFDNRESKRPNGMSQNMDHWLVPAYYEEESPDDEEKRDALREKDWERFRGVSSGADIQDRVPKDNRDRNLLVGGAIWFAVVWIVWIVGQFIQSAYSVYQSTGPSRGISLGQAIAKVDYTPSGQTVLVIAALFFFLILDNGNQRRAEAVATHLDKTNSKLDVLLKVVTKEKV